MKEIGWAIRLMETENILMPMGLFMKEAGKMTNSMELEKKCGQTIRLIEETMIWGISMGEAHLHGLMEALMKDNSQRI